MLQCQDLGWPGLHIYMSEAVARAKGNFFKVGEDTVCEKLGIYMKLNADYLTTNSKSVSILKLP